MQHKKMKVAENGRTMVEMLGVLALIGILAVGGIVGYSYAMRLYQEAETLDALSVTIGGGRTWDIPENYGAKTVGVGEDYVPYVVPIREVVSRVNYRNEQTAIEAGLVDEMTGMLTPGWRMNDVREYESFNSLVDAPVWVRAEDEYNWTVRMVGVSYDMCEKILHKKELGFDYAYVAQQNEATKEPLDPSTRDFGLVDLKYMNTDDPQTENEKYMANKERIKEICLRIDAQQSPIQPARVYIHGLEEGKEAAIAPGTEATVCSDKKSLRCMASGARILNQETKKIDVPLQTLVLYFGKGGDAENPVPCVGPGCVGPDLVCCDDGPYTQESGCKKVDEQCCLDLGNTMFRADTKDCCQVGSDQINEPRCVLDSTGFHAIDVREALDGTRTEEPMRTITTAITSDTPIYLIAGTADWNGTKNPKCCDAKLYKTDDFDDDHQCHVSDITHRTLPWPIETEQGFLSGVYVNNCPHSVVNQDKVKMSRFCCQASGGYWTEHTGERKGTIDYSTLYTGTAKATCCAKSEILDYQPTQFYMKCNWEHKPVVALGALIGPEPVDILDKTNPNCCYKMEDSQTGLLKDTPCAYEAGVLKFSKTCCELSVDKDGNNYKYVSAPYSSGTVVNPPNCGASVDPNAPSVSETDRNCCVDYVALEASIGKPLDPKNISITDFTGISNPEYCCSTLIGTANAPNENRMKHYYKDCCEAELYFNTASADVRQKGAFFAAGDVIQKYLVPQICPAPYVGNHCVQNTAPYVVPDNVCCDPRGYKTIDGSENRTCCLNASQRLSMYWDAGLNQCVGCPSCQQTPPPPPPPPPPVLEDCYKTCDETVVYPETREEQTVDVCNSPCSMKNNVCCHSTEGHDHTGAPNLACCPSGAVSINQKAKNITAASCLEQVTIPLIVPGSTVQQTKNIIVKCPEGVAPGTHLGHIGPCPGDGNNSDDEN